MDSDPPFPPREGHWVVRFFPRSHPRQLGFVSAIVGDLTLGEVLHFPADEGGGGHWFNDYRF